MLTESVEHYLKAIYEIQEEKGRAETGMLAERLDVTPASVTGMLKKLSGEKPALVEYKAHHGARLTDEGIKFALKVIRHHRLMETFLVKALGFPCDEVHEEADRLEHYISDKLEEKIDKYLGFPSFDPHGAPIPSHKGKMPETNYIPLWDLPENQYTTVRRIREFEHGVINYLHQIGINPGVKICITEKAPFGGPVSIRIESAGDTTVHALGRKVAESVFVDG